MGSDQRRYFIDTDSHYRNYLENQKKYAMQYKYGMVWTGPGGNYLAKATNRQGGRKYLGVRSEETEKIYEGFIIQRDALKARIVNSKKELDRLRKINKAIGLGRIPSFFGKIVRRFNELDFDKNLIVVGTNALYAYEMRYGVLFEQKHLATEDFDLLHKNSRRLSLLFRDRFKKREILQLFKSIDKTFMPMEGVPFRLINSGGTMVDILNPAGYKPAIDIVELSLEGLKWLEGSSVLQQTVIDENGYPALISTIAPVDFAIYKFWLSRMPTRETIKRPRDLLQANMVIHLIREYGGEDPVREICTRTHFPRELLQQMTDQIVLQEEMGYEGLLEAKPDSGLW